MITVHLGNPAPLDAGRPIPGPQVTTAFVPTTYTESEQLRTIVHDDGIWPAHSSAPAPSWVDADDANLAEALSNHYGCPVGRPAENPVNGAN